MTDIAVILPCYNEEAAIGKTVRDFRAALPQAKVYVYDNNSKDRTAEVAREAGAIVRNEPRQGKGNVMRRMFADVEADIYVLADGDDTYDASVAPALIAKLVERRSSTSSPAGASTPRPRPIAPVMSGATRCSPD